MRVLSRIISRWRRTEDGTAAAEFAFAAPVLIFAAIGSIGLATMMFVFRPVEGGPRSVALRHYRRRAEPLGVGHIDI